jgi:nicotinamidase-related amidase
MGDADRRGIANGAEPPAGRTYQNRLTRIARPQPILADFPEFVEPIVEESRFEGPPIVDDPAADLEVRAWRYSYNARGIIETSNRVRGAWTAVIVVHPWGIDDGQGWRSPEPAGVALFCTPAKNQVYLQHVRTVVNPFLQSWRSRVSLIGYSLPGNEDPIRKKLYRSIRGRPTDAERRKAAARLADTLNRARYVGQPVIPQIFLSETLPVRNYFQQFPSLDSGPNFNGVGFWELPIPVVKPIEVDPEDVVIYDGDGYPALREFLVKQSIRHVLLAGYATDMCLCRTTAGYENLEKDFNVFIVGDATMATFPAMASPRVCTTAALALASRDHLITQASWVRALSTGHKPATDKVGTAPR